MQNKGLHIPFFLKKNIIIFDDIIFFFFSEMIDIHLISWFIDLFISLLLKNNSALKTQ